MEGSSRLSGLIPTALTGYGTSIGHGTSVGASKFNVFLDRKIGCDLAKVRPIGNVCSGHILRLLFD